MERRFIHHLRANKHLLKGEWVSKNCNYENDVCDLLNMKCEMTRYWDGTYGRNPIRIEIKKGNSIWLDEVRYAEQKLSDPNQHLLTMFLIPNSTKTCIQHIYIVHLQTLFNFLKMNNVEWCEYLLKRNEEINHSLNCQQRMCIGDLKDIAEYHI